MPVSLSKPIVGVDVAKNELVIYQSGGDLLEEIRAKIHQAVADALDAKLLDFAR